MVSDEQLIEDFQEFAKELGRTPKVKQMNDSGPWHATTYIDHFGSWNEAVKKAGYETNSHATSQRKERVKVECSECGNIMNVLESRLNRHDNIFCSRECSNNFKTGPNYEKREGEQKECSYCGSGVYVSPSHLELDNHFCDEECHKNYLNENRKGKNIKCEECGEEIYRPPSKLSKFDEHFCSTECRGKSHTGKDHPQWSKITVECDSCGKEFKRVPAKVGDKNFCSVECRGVDRRKRVYKTCKTCGNEFWVWESHIGQRPAEYCSFECSGEGKSIDEKELVNKLKELKDKIGKTPSLRDMDNFGEYSSTTYVNNFGTWNLSLEAAGMEPIEVDPLGRGIETNYEKGVKNFYGAEWRNIREEIINRDCGHCRVCSNTNSLHVHHIKPRRTFANPSDSNKKNNLITLCNSCHKTFEGMWTDADPDEFEEKAKELYSQRA